MLHAALVPERDEVRRYRGQTLSILETQSYAEYIALIFGIIAVVIGIFEATSKNIEKLIIKRQARIRQRNIIGLLISPTQEELSKYSAQQYVKYTKKDLAELSYMEAKRQRRNRLMKEYYDKNSVRAFSRLATLALVFSALFLILTLRYISILWL